MIKSKNEAMKDVGKKLNKKIAVQKRAMGKDPIGNEVESWVHLAHIWSDTQAIWGKDFYEAKKMGEEKTIKFLLRNSDLIRQMNTADYRLVNDGTKYNITKIDFLPNDLWTIISGLEIDTNG